MKIQNIVVSTAFVAVFGISGSHARHALEGTSDFERKLGVIGGRHLEFTEQCLNETDTLDMQIEDAYDAYEDASTTTDSCTEDATKSTCTYTFNTPDSAVQALTDACNGVDGLEVFSYGKTDITCTWSNGTFTGTIVYSYNQFADCYAESCGFDKDSFITESEKDFEESLNDLFGVDNTNCEIGVESAASDLMMPFGWASVAASAAAMFFAYLM